MTDTTTPQTQMSGRDINQVRQILTNEMGLTRETIRDIAQRQTGVSNEAWAAYVEMLEPSAQWLEVCRPAGQQLKVVVHDGAQSLWHLHVLLDWFAATQRRQVDQALLDLSEATMTLNIAREARRLRGAVLPKGLERLFA